MSTERELFEAWALSRKCPPELLEAGGDYGGRGLIAGQWAAWQAARSADTSGARWQLVGWLAVCKGRFGYAHHSRVVRSKHDAETIAKQWAGSWGKLFVVEVIRVGERLEPPPAAPGGPARRPDENSPSGPSDRALNPQPEAVDHDRGAL